MKNVYINERKNMSGIVPKLEPVPKEVFDRQPLEQKVEILYHQVQCLIDVMNKTNRLIQSQSDVTGRMLKVMDRLSTISN